jgi:phosphoribosylformimino-5-aminoimidazole carboxamide ribotide isomerase
MTKEFLLFPAIDLRHGKVVRLSEGDPSRQTRYSDSPAGVAREWLNDGAKWLHVINLDGALEGDAFSNREALVDILKSAKEHGAFVQYGGGIRSLDIAQELIDLGVQRVILGTLAVAQPDIVQQAVARWGSERVAVSLDARGSEVMVRGWRESGAVDIWTVAAHLKSAGLKWLIFTDVSRDGMQTGFNRDTTFELAWQSGLDVIAAGGVRSIDDILSAKQAFLGGIILGRALYEGNVDLKEAFERVQNAG